MTSMPLKVVLNLSLVQERLPHCTGLQLRASDDLSLVHRHSIFQSHDTCRGEFFPSKSWTFITFHEDAILVMPAAQAYK
jgi:hypothetical protein